MITRLEDVTEHNLKQEMQDIARRLDLQNPDDALYFPKYFQIETVRVCNARCPFCAIDQWDKSVPLMSDTLFNKIADEMAGYTHWIEFVAVQRAGEPLLDKKLGARVRRLKEVGIKRVSIATNASMLTEKKAIELLSAGLDEAMLSIDSVEKKEYERMRVGLRYERVIQNIRTFFRVRDEINPSAVVRVRGVSFYNIDNKEDRSEMRRWEDFWNELKKPQDRIYLKRAHNWGNQKVWEGYTPNDEPVYHPCVLPWSTMHITAMGVVPLCPQDYDAKMNIGDINVQTIAEVWRSENWDRIRRLHRTGNRSEIPFCQGCRIFDREFSLEKWQQKELYEG